MATQKSQFSDSNNSRLFGWIGFVVVVALFLFVSDKAGMRGIGVSMIAAAWLHRSDGRVPYGWEGRPPSGHITGWPATVLTLVVGLAGLALVIWPEVAIAIFDRRYAPLSSLMSSL